MSEPPNDERPTQAPSATDVPQSDGGKSGKPAGGEKPPHLPDRANRQQGRVPAKHRGHKGRDMIMPGRAVPFAGWQEVVGHVDFLATMRRTRRRRFYGRLGIFVGLPTLVALLYVLFFATPRYVTEFEVTYQTFQTPQTLSAGLVQTLLGSTSPTSVDPGAILYEYIRSGTLLAKVDEKLHVRQYYSSDKIDYPIRLSANASNEKFLSYYRWHIISVSEGMGGYLTVGVQAFDPQYATALARAIVQACDEMMDNMTARARQDEVRFAESELKRQEERVVGARQAMTRFQNLHGDLNPQDVANQLGQIAGGIEAALAQARTELRGALSAGQPTSPQVISIRSRIAALEQQLRDERGRLANNGGENAYSEILDQYSRLQLEQEFSKDAYLAAQQGLTVARADAARKQAYLVDFVLPSQPDHPTMWLGIIYVATAFFGSLMIYAIMSVLVGAFRDQAGL